MYTTKCEKFKGNIEQYLNNGKSNLDSRIAGLFSKLQMKTMLYRARIIKWDGYHASHLFFISMLLPLLRIKTVKAFCDKQWLQWSPCQKDAFYRFKQNGTFRWRSFLYQVTGKIFSLLDKESIPLKDRYFILDDTVISKRGALLENVSYVFDHVSKRSVLGYSLVLLGMAHDNGFYPLDFAYRFGKKRHYRSPEEVIGDPRSQNGQRSYEAKHSTKVSLALQMIERAIKAGFVPGYILFDSWYSSPTFINSIRRIDERVHVVCRLKATKTRYHYKKQHYTLPELYQLVRKKMKEDKRTGLTLGRIKVFLAGSEHPVTIIFSKGYSEPQESPSNGQRIDKQEKWVAFLSTDTSLHASSIIGKYIKRWSIEICFKECKQLLGLGKDQSRSFTAQVFATTMSFFRYTVLNYFNEQEQGTTLGKLFEQLADDMAVVTYAQRLWQFFRYLFSCVLKSIFDLFELHDDFNDYMLALEQVVTSHRALQGCET